MQVIAISIGLQLIFIIISIAGQQQNELFNVSASISFHSCYFPFNYFSLGILLTVLLLHCFVFVRVRKQRENLHRANLCRLLICVTPKRVSMCVLCLQHKWVCAICINLRKFLLKIAIDCRDRWFDCWVFFFSALWNRQSLVDFGNFRDRQTDANQMFELMLTVVALLSLNLNQC